MIDRCRDCYYVNVTKDRFDDICDYTNKTIDVDIFAKIPTWCPFLGRELEEDYEL